MRLKQTTPQTFVAVVGLLIVSVLCDNDCSGHGQWDKHNATCICDSPKPAGDKIGYGGSSCEIPIFTGIADGLDMTHRCQAHNCSTLQPKDWSCFYLNLNSNDDWNYLAVELNRTSKEGDPDLYGLLYSSKEENAASPVGLAAAFDFQETSSGLHPWVVKTIAKRDIKLKDVEGIWLCVHAYGKSAVTFSLRAISSPCPSSFDEHGGMMQCSSPVVAAKDTWRHTGCNDEGECICKPPYTRPVEETYSGLGFESCAAEVVPLIDDMLNKNGTLELMNQTATPGAWMFYEFNVTDADYQVEINVMEEAASRGMVEVYVQYAQPPGEHYHQWEFSRQYSYDWYSYGVDEILFDRTMDEFRTGRWFIGVLGDRHGSVNYTLLLSKYTCPLNCSDRGVCRAGVCQCDEGYGGNDCSRERRNLEYGVPVVKEEAAFEYDYYTLPPLEYDLVNRSIDFSIAVAFQTTDGNFPKWALSKPEVLVLKGAPDSLPSVRNYTFKRILDKPNTTYTLTLCASQLAEGTWHTALYNPGHLWSFAYNLTLHKNARCLNNCNGNGKCDEDGQCQCEAGWTGGDCSVNAAGTCIKGSRQMQHRPEDHGICWFECQCDDHHATCNYYNQVCVDFTCDPPTPQLNPYRRVIGKDKCVRDECVRDEWVEDDTFVCLKKCTCPSDGSSCTLGSRCDPETITCKNGYKLHGDETNRMCYEEGCAEGSLKAVLDTDLPHAQKVFSVCKCSSDYVEGQARCTFSYTQSDLVLYCEEGYSVQAAVRDDSSGMWLGGSCAAAKRGGLPAWGVTLLVMGALLGGAVLGVLGVWLYDTKFGRIPHFESQGLYQELSLGNMGF